MGSDAQQHQEPLDSTLPSTTNSSSFSSSSKTGMTTTMAVRTAEANRKLESTAQAAVNWGVQHECQIRDFEAELASALSNSRAVHHLLVEALGSIESNRQRVDRALTQHIPHIYTELNNSMLSLQTLQSRLPELRSQIHAIRSAYDSGRFKAQTLQHELEWKRAPIQEKLLRVALARPGDEEGMKKIPVKRSEVIVVRIVLVICMLVICWQLGGALDGAYRAYRHRLVWGDKLIS